MRILLCLLTLLGFAAAPTFARNRNIAYQDKAVRFTVITDGALRLEYSPKGKFVDNKSLIAINRSYAPSPFTVEDKDGYVTISTSKLVLRYHKGNKPLSRQNLTITSAKGRSPHFEWHPGDVDDANLKGTFRTLDQCDGNKRNGKPVQFEPGLLSRNGWTLIDDSNSLLFDDSQFPWAIQRKKGTDTQDWYFLSYGHDYKKALKDFTIFAGKIPIPPRYAFGYWWSRFWDYSDDDLRQLIDKFHRYDIPLDVLVIDMDWHYATSPLGGWTGYTWNRRLFPDPARFLGWVKSQQLKVTLNLHPANGIKSYEECYPDMAKWMGINPSKKIDIPWQSSSKRFMSGWINTVLRPMETMGVDFWWPDWQQEPYDNVMKHLSNTWWINYVLFTDMERNRSTRPLLYHRWGGLGNHRYQIGFSGDALITWNSLDFQPYFNSTASNVLYGYWSHDIGGHMGADSINPEMYIRWMQFGMFSPILRTHSTKNSGLNKEPWAFADKYQDIIHDIIHHRYALVPYIYTMARKAYDEAISICRPLYYDYPEAEEAYIERNEYLFGDNILVDPVTSPMQGQSSAKKIWLPDGSKWYEISSGTTFDGGKYIDRNFYLDEIPVYVKDGAILPLYNNVYNLNSNSDSITVAVFPGASKGQFSLYEDGGTNKDYDTAYARTSLSYVRSADSMIVTISPRKGNYLNMPTQRHFNVQLVASAIPVKVKVNGKSVPFTYDGDNLTVNVSVKEDQCSIAKTIVFFFDANLQTLDDGLIGKMKNIHRIVKKAKQDNSEFVITQRMGQLDGTSRKLSYNPKLWKETIKNFCENYNHLDEILKEQGL